MAKEARKLRRLNEFEWASVAQYVIYISSLVGLEEMRADDVISFPLARLGPLKVIARKERCLDVLEGNKKLIERFVGENEPELDDDEISVLRSLYIQYRDSALVVRGHLRVAELYLAELDGVMGVEVEEGQDVFPF